MIVCLIKNGAMKNGLILFTILSILLVFLNGSWEDDEQYSRERILDMESRIEQLNVRVDSLTATLVHTSLDRDRIARLYLEEAERNRYLSRRLSRMDQ